MKKLLTIFLLCLLAAGIAGCGGGSTSTGLSDSTRVTINLGATAGASGSGGDFPVAFSIPSNIVSIKFIISGYNMTTIEKVVSTEGKTAISEYFIVPNGDKRHFAVKAADSAGIVKYIGHTYADLHGTPAQLTINMTTIDLNGRWSAYHKKTGGSEEGRDCVTITQTGSSLGISFSTTDRNYSGSGTIHGDQMQITFSAGIPECGSINSITITGTLIDANTINGTYTSSGGCSPDSGAWWAIRDNACVPASPASGTITGVVKDSATQAHVQGVAVKVYKENYVVSGTTDSNGAFSLSVVSGSGYTAEFSKTGYTTASVGNITVAANTTTALSTVFLTGTAPATGNVSGKIVNALTGQGAGGITINLRSGTNVTTGTIVVTTTTQTDGSYSFSSLNAGTYTAEISGSGYITTYFTVVCVAGTTTPNQNAAITPVMASGETRIVLTWGATPADLDSHLTGPTPAGSRFHIYFGNMEYIQSGVKHAALDLDDTSSYGPETTTIYSQLQGVYRFSVHDYTNADLTTSTALSNSGAQVRVYRGNSLVSTFNVPANTGGTLWKVFELSGDTITLVNTMSYVSDETSIQIAPSGKRKKLTLY